MKILKKYWKKIFGLTLTITLGVYVCFFAIKKVLDLEIYKQPEIETKVYEIWHVETFEGGAKPRINYLKNIALAYEKEHDGVLFMIKSISPNTLESTLTSATPHMISFGFGVGKTVLPVLKNLDKTFDVRDELVESGSFNNKLYATPYIVSGYAVLTHSIDNENFCYGTNKFVNPTKNAEIKSKNLTALESQYEAYKQFVNTKNYSLIGTARDVYRVNNLNNIGRTNAMINPLRDYTDLIQYIGATTFDEHINNFLSLVLSDENQNKLADYSLFSAKHTKLYQTGIYNDMENAILNCQIPNVFDD